MSKLDYLSVVCNRNTERMLDFELCEDGKSFEVTAWDEEHCVMVFYDAQDAHTIIMWMEAFLKEQEDGPWTDDDIERLRAEPRIPVPEGSDPLAFIDDEEEE